jgi:hypothetical protein
MTGKDLKRLVTHWRARLGMDHWTLEVRFATQEEMGADERNGVCGRIWPDLDTLTARVQIIREQDIDAEMLEALALCPDGRAVIEQTVIHELLHARLDPCSHVRDDDNFESGLNRIAYALWEGAGLTK